MFNKHQKFKHTAIYLSIDFEISIISIFINKYLFY